MLISYWDHAKVVFILVIALYVDSKPQHSSSHFSTVALFVHES